MNSLVFTDFASAVNLGVKGQLFEIEEMDIRVQMIMELNQNLSHEKFQKTAQDEADKFYKNLPRHLLIESHADKVDYIDPTRVYEDAYWSFKKSNSNEYEWFKVAEAGSEVNWLEHHVGEIQKFFIFDSQSQVQLEVAKKLIYLNDPFLSLVFTGGDLVSVKESVQGEVNYLNESVIREYDLQYTPSLVQRGRGKFKNFYKVTRFSVDDLSFDEVFKNLKGIENE